MTVPCPTLSRRALVRAATLPFTLAALSALVACSPRDPAPKPVVDVQAADAYGLLAKEGKGFTVGALMAANTVYVLFDPQCPHCGRLWQQSLPLHSKVKFVWMPVAFINAKSQPQGVALLTAANPLEAMNAHEASILAGSGGTAASSNMAEDMVAAIEKNTALFNRMGVESVPYIVAKDARTGAVVTNAGAMETAALAQFLGLG